MMYGWLIKIGIVAALLAGFGFWCWTGGAASVKKEWQLATAKQVAEQLAATEQARATEQALQQKVNDANTALKTERAKHARVAAGLKRDADSLRNEITQFAGGKPEESTATCRERASTIGELLGEALRVSGECAVEAESTAADLRAVLGAWPR